jgi:phosphatidylinositol phospholipase C delta
LYSGFLRPSPKVEYYPPTTTEYEPESSSDPEHDEAETHSISSAGRKKDTEHAYISDALAALGCYARSMKPGKNWLQQGKATVSWGSHPLLIF